MEGVNIISIPLQGSLCKFQNCSSKFQGRRHSGWKSWETKTSQRLEEEPVSKQGIWGTIFPICQQRSFLSEYLRYQQIVHPTRPFLELLGAESGNVCRISLLVGHNLKIPFQEKQLLSQQNQSSYSSVLMTLQYIYLNHWRCDSILQA